MKLCQLAPGSAVHITAEMALSELEIARDAGMAAVQGGVAGFKLCVLPNQPGAFEVEGPERGATAAKGEEAGAHVVHEARPCPLFAAQGAPGPARISLQHQHAMA